MLLRFRPLNWRLLLLHFLAVPLLILGGRQLQLIPHAWMIELYQQGGMQALQNSPRYVSAENISALLVHPLYAWFISILVGCLLSALVVWHRRESRLIPVLLFVAAIVSSWTRYDTSPPVRSVLAWVRGPLEAWSSETGFAVVGGALVLLGLLPFLFTWRRPQNS